MKLNKKYNPNNLTPKTKFIVKSIPKDLVWRNDVINAYCLSGGSGTGCYDETMSSWWIGLYDIGEVEFSLSSDGGLTRIVLDDFHQKLDEDFHEHDYNVIKKLVETLNILVDLDYIERVN
jgi:hypothetical protein